VIADDVIREIIVAAQFAPTAHGTGAVEFIVITQQQTKDAIFAIVGQEYVKEAPVLIMPVATDQSMLPVQDLSVASQNIFLQATALGLGSVWKNLSPEWEVQVKSLLGIPENCRAINLIPIGVPDEKVAEHSDEKFTTEKIHDEKW
jgi:nitroreductase